MSSERRARDFSIAILCLGRSKGHRSLLEVRRTAHKNPEPLGKHAQLLVVQWHPNVPSSGWVVLRKQAGWGKTRGSAEFWLRTPVQSVAITSVSDKFRHWPQASQALSALPEIEFLHKSRVHDFPCRIGPNFSLGAVTEEQK